VSTCAIRPSSCAGIFVIFDVKRHWLSSAVDRFLGWSSPPWLRSLPQPTLVMVGTDDALIPVGGGRILARLIANARMVTTDDGRLFLVTRAAESESSFQIS